MQIIHYVQLAYSRGAVGGFVVNSLPKSGTHLLLKAAGRFAGLYKHRAAALPNARSRFADPDSGDTVLVGIGWPRPISAQDFQKVLRSVKSRRFARWHVPYTPEAAALVAASGIKMLLMVRDPRDVVFSQVRYILDTNSHRLHAYFQSLSENERILASINGVTPLGPGGPGLQNIDARCRSLLQWRDLPGTHLVKFERLVGEKGGGSRAEQMEELRGIAAYLTLDTTDQELERIADSIFGGTHTFRKGQIGGWQARFTDEYRRAFKAVAGPMLIEMGYASDTDW